MNQKNARVVVVPRDAKRYRGRPATRWGDLFAVRLDQLRAQLDTARGSTSLTKLENISDNNDEGTNQVEDAGARTYSEEGLSSYLSTSKLSTRYDSLVSGNSLMQATETMNCR
ncbi:hypothetical protein RB195_020955 [Necator americanus]|uniref:Uncharacterized protein n=1 Tax=Necator americanus TaxID=51031 RepID=A0ABR1CLE0_NECAM